MSSLAATRGAVDDRWVSKMTTREPRWVARAINNAWKTEFKPEKFDQGTFRPKVGNRVPQMHMAYTGHVPGCRDYHLAESHGSFVNKIQLSQAMPDDVEATYSMANTGFAPKQGLQEPMARPYTLFLSSTKAALRQGVPGSLDKLPPIDSAGAAPPATTDEIICNAQNHLYRTHDGYTRKDNGGLWRSVERKQWEWGPKKHYY